MSGFLVVIVMYRIPREKGLTTRKPIVRNLGIESTLCGFDFYRVRSRVK